MTSNTQRPPVTVITGANSGIGLDAAHRVAALGGTVVLLCRNEERGLPALAGVRERSGNQDVHLVTADFASLDQVRLAAQRISSAWPALSALVNNAGLASMARRTTGDGFEVTLQVNHLAHFLLTRLLLPALRAGRGRVVNVSSGAHRGGRLDRAPLDEILRGPEPYRGVQAYCDSKLANLHFTFELADREAGTGVTANALHPGALSTPLWDRNPGWHYWAGQLLKPFMRGPGVGGDAACWLATDPVLDGVTGRYYDQRKPGRLSRRAQDPAMARALWDASSRAVGLDS